MAADKVGTVADADGNELGKIFIGGLSQVTNEVSLRAYFSQYGQVEDAVVMMDNQTGRSRGFGFIKFKDPDCVESVLVNQEHAIDCKSVDVKQSNIHVKGKASRSLKIFVGGIAPEHNARVMQNFFSQYGKVVEVNLMLDQAKQRHRGFAFVTFDDERVVQRLVQLHFVNINGRVVEIKAMKPATGAAGGREALATGRLLEQQQQQQQLQYPLVYHAQPSSQTSMWHPMTFDSSLPAWTTAWAGQQWCRPQLSLVEGCWPQALVTWPGMVPAQSAASALLQPLAWDCQRHVVMEQGPSGSLADEEALPRSPRQSSSAWPTAFKEALGSQPGHGAAGDFDQQGGGLSLQREP